MVLWTPSPRAHLGGGCDHLPPTLHGKVGGAPSSCGCVQECSAREEEEEQLVGGPVHLRICHKSMQSAHCAARMACLLCPRILFKAKQLLHVCQSQIFAFCFASFCALPSSLRSSMFAAPHDGCVLRPKCSWRRWSDLMAMMNVGKRHSHPHFWRLPSHGWPQIQKTCCFSTFVEHTKPNNALCLLPELSSFCWKNKPAQDHLKERMQEAG